MQINMEKSPRASKAIDERANGLSDAYLAGKNLISVRGVVKSQSGPHILDADPRYFNYIYLDPRKQGVWEYHFHDLYLRFDFMPIYIGKGCRDRHLHHIREVKRKPIPERGARFKNTLRSMISEGVAPIVMKFNESQIESISLAIEVELISLIGRDDLGTGPLLNASAGGDGAAKISAESRMRKSISSTGRKHSLETREVMRHNALARDKSYLSSSMHSDAAREKAKKTLGDGRQIGKGKGAVRSDDFRKGVSRAHTGKIVSDETRKKISLSKLSREKVKCQYCEVCGDPSLMKRWHFENCKNRSGS